MVADRDYDIEQEQIEHENAIADLEAFGAGEQAKAEAEEHNMMADRPEWFPAIAARDTLPSDLERVAFDVGAKAGVQTLIAWLRVNGERVESVPETGRGWVFCIYGEAWQQLEQEVERG
jgi:hypothetical protein